MHRTLSLCVFLFISLQLHAQPGIKILVKNDEAVLPGSSMLIVQQGKTLLTDSNGVILYDGTINPGDVLRFSHTGFNTRDHKYAGIVDSILTITLERNEEELDEVTVSSTRSDGLIKNIPTRIELIAPEELDEKSSMKPGDIRMLLNESTGISTQQTSAVSGTANIRIQGLDGRYTQLLKDGMPLYSGFSGGLSILQIAPLDLKQAEYIKGSASTLYGGGAISGLVNLVTKTPGPTRELNFLLNANSANGFDVNGFFSKKWKKVGSTIFGSYNQNAAYDPSTTGFSAIPKTKRLTFNPKIFFYPSDKTTAWFGINSSFENRLGGDMQVIKGHTGSLHQYFERNETSRLSTQFSLTHNINAKSRINIKNSVGLFNRELSLPAYTFTGHQVSTFSEASYLHKGSRSEWILGLNEWTEKFTPEKSTTLHYKLSTVGAFAQNTFTVNNWFSIESGLRADRNSPASAGKSKGIFLLPRLNMLFKINSELTSRIGGGMGYKMPTVFTDDAETRAYRNIMPINFSTLHAEESVGFNGDINYKKQFDETRLVINQFFFYTRLNHPILLGSNAFVNVPGYLDTKGAETNLKVNIDDLSLYLGYTYTDTRRHFLGTDTRQPLSAKHRVNADLMYEIEHVFRVGVEGFYTGQQLLSDGTTGRSYMIFGLLVQKMWKHLDFFINAENLTDRRQTRFGNFVTGTSANPLFQEIYAPLDGAVFNSGVKIRL